MSNQIKMVALDIETSPLQVYTWGLWNQNIGLPQIKEYGRIICFSAQWYGSKKVIFKSEYHDSPEEVLRTLHEILDEADVVVGWNSTSFDVPWIEGELQLAGFNPPSPFHQLDLMRHFRRHSKFASKKLAAISQRLLGDTKLTHTGFQLWRDCIEPDTDPDVKRKAWNLMRRYAIKDTRLLWPIFEEVKGWIKVPLPVLIDPEVVRCRNCGSDNIQWRGFAYTSASVFKRFQCQEPGCGRWDRVATRDHAIGALRAL